jgi:hypothetical protein
MRISADSLILLEKASIMASKDKNHDTRQSTRPLGSHYYSHSGNRHRPGGHLAGGRSDGLAQRGKTQAHGRGSADIGPDPVSQSNLSANRHSYPLA